MNEPNPFPVDKAPGDEDGRSVDAGRPVEWLRGGWTLFIKCPLLWIGLGVVSMLLIIVPGSIPMLGQLAISFLTPILGAGLLLGCRSLSSGGELTFGHLFAGFSQNTGSLLMVGVLTLFGFVAIALVVFVIGGGALLTGVAMGSDGGVGTALGGVAIAGLLALALSVPLSMAVWFAPALVVFKNMPPVQAMRTSFFACLKNVGPFLVYGLIVMVLGFVATLPVLLGWLVLFPVLVGSHYCSYVDLFE